MAKVLGFCNLHDAPRLGKLTEKRSIGTVSFLGRYGLMDFALSNFSNSGLPNNLPTIINWFNILITLLFF